MRIITLVIGLLAVVAPVLAYWSEKDREIFRVRDELAGALGSDVTFYDFLGVSSSASLDDINKAYRRKTRSLHPDKVKQQLTAERAAKSQSKLKNAKKNKPGTHVSKGPSSAEVRAAVKKASEMQARLSIVANILRGPERDRYDHFLTNGFPVWKGTGYYYNRYRPGFGTVFFGLFIFIGGAAHYLTLYMSWKRQREFMDRYIRFARQTAWGNTLGIDGGSGSATGAAPGFTALVSPPANAATDDDENAPAAALNRRQRRMQERESRKDDQRSGSARRGGGGGRRAAGNSGTATPTQPSGPTGAKKRVVAENGKLLIVDSLGDVYLEQVDEEGNVEELLLDIETIVPPTYRDTAVYRLPVWLYGLSIGRVLPTKNADKGTVGTAERDDDESSAGKATPSTDSNEEFELLGASTESLGRAQATGNSSGNNGKSSRRKGKR